jgi:hypothetical protein
VGQVGRVQGRAGEQEVDPDVAGHLGQVAGQGRRGPEAAAGVLPDRRHAVVDHAVLVQVGVVDVPVVGPGLRPGRQVVEPHPAEPAEPVLLVVGSGAAPGDQLAALGLDAEVEAAVGLGLVGLGVDVELEVRPPVPVDEEDGVLAGVDAGRRVVGQPALDRRGVDVVVVGDLEDVVLLVVVGLLELGQGGRLGQLGEVEKNLFS